jgi:hypothetical protein
VSSSTLAVEVQRRPKNSAARQRVCWRRKVGQS